MFTKEQQKQNLKEFRKNFKEQLLKLRNDNNFSIENLSKDSNIPKHALQKAEEGDYKNWGTIFELARFYEKKIRLEFY